MFQMTHNYQLGLAVLVFSFIFLYFLLCTDGLCIFSHSETAA